MQDFYPQVVKSLSSARLDDYRNALVKPSNLDVMTAYIQNIRISQALSPSIHILEVALRNSLHNAFSTAFKANDWYDTPNLLGTKQKDQLKLAKDKIGSTSKAVTPDLIVANLSFGFWVALFNHPYQNSIWQIHSNLLKECFPRAPRYARTRLYMSQLLYSLRLLRNDISHWDRIKIDPNFNKCKADLDRMIGWLSPAAECLHRSVDNLAEILSSNAEEKSRYFAGRCFLFNEISAM